MEILSVVKLGTHRDKILREDLTKIETTAYEVRKHRARMEKLCRTHNGVGLAANQVGLRLNFFLAMPSAHLLNSKISELVINPEWEPEDDRKFVSEEGCLSLTKGQKFKVWRYSRIRARWTGGNGKPLDWRVLKVYAGTVFQHETDHLRGILLCDHPEIPEVTAMEQEMKSNTMYFK